MATHQSTAALQPYGMLLYRGPVHPEFFKIAGRKQSSHPDFDFEAWIFPGGHVLRFEHATTTLCEVITDTPTELPERGLVTTLPCNGERDFEEIFGDRITFVTSIQTETLSDHLYLGTYQEMFEHGKDPAHLMTTWKETVEHPSLSLIEFQRYQDQVHVQTYHLRGETLSVLRTQSIFQAGVEEEEEDEGETDGD